MSLLIVFDLDKTLISDHTYGEYNTFPSDTTIEGGIVDFIELKKYLHELREELNKLTPRINLYIAIATRGANQERCLSKLRLLEIPAENCFVQAFSEVRNHFMNCFDEAYVANKIKIYKDIWGENCHTNLNKVLSREYALVLQSITNSLANNKDGEKLKFGKNIHCANLLTMCNSRNLEDQVTDLVLIDDDIKNLAAFTDHFNFLIKKFPSQFFPNPLNYSVVYANPELHEDRFLSKLKSEVEKIILKLTSSQIISNSQQNSFSFFQSAIVNNNQREEIIAHNNSASNLTSH